MPTTHQACAVSASCLPQLVYKTDPDGSLFCNAGGEPKLGCTWLPPHSQIWRRWHPEVTPLPVLLHRSRTSMELSTLSGEQTDSPPTVRTSAGESRWWWAPRGSRRGVGAGKGCGPSTRCKPSCRSFRPTLRRREGKLLVCRERTWRPQGHRKCSVNTCHDPHSCYRDCHVIALSRADHLRSHRE